MPTPPGLQLADVSSSPLPITLWHREAAGGLSHHQGDPGPCRHVESRENASLEVQNHLEPAGLGSKGPRPSGSGEPGEQGPQEGARSRVALLSYLS